MRLSFPIPTTYVGKSLIVQKSEAFLSIKVEQSEMANVNVEPNEGNEGRYIQQ